MWNKSIGILCSLFCASVFGAEPAFVLWDSAVIADPVNVASRKSVQILYSSQPLIAGQSVATFVPLGKSYRVMCCLVATSGVDLTIQGLIRKFSADQDFVKRVRSIKGARYVYDADFSSGVNKNMKAMMEGVDGPYYSAVGLVGTTDVERIKGQTFGWDGYGQVMIKTEQAPKGAWRHVLSGKDWRVTIEEPALPD